MSSFFLKIWVVGARANIPGTWAWLAERPAGPKTQHGSELDLSFVAASYDSSSLVHCVRWLLVP